MNTPSEVTGPMNLGNTEEFTILELASLVIKLTGARSKVVHRPRPQDDPRQRRPDISKANDILKWAPKTKLADGLSKTIAYIDDLLRDGARLLFTIGCRKSSDRIRRDARRCSANVARTTGH